MAVSDKVKKEIKMDFTNYLVVDSELKFCPPPVAPEGMKVVPYYFEGHCGGFYWAIVPNAATEAEIKAEGHLALYSGHVLVGQSVVKAIGERVDELFTYAFVKGQEARRVEDKTAEVAKQHWSRACALLEVKKALLKGMGEGGEHKDSMV